MKRLLILLVPLVVIAFILIPLGLKYLNPPSYAPRGYHVEYDNKKTVGRAVRLTDMNDKHHITLYNTTEMINECNGVLRDLGGTQACWQVELPKNNTDKSLVTWKKNDYMYVLSTNADLTQDEVANVVKNFN